MHRPPLVRLGAALAVVLALAGCDGGGVATTPVPSISPILPTTSGTAILPSASPSGTPSLITVRPTTSAETEALAAEAEQVYVAYQKLRLKYEAQGGVDGPLPEDLKQYVAGVEQSAAEAVLRQVASAGSRLENVGAMRFIRQGIFVDDLEPTVLIGLQMCDDASSVTHISADGTESEAATLMQRSQFARGPEGRLRVIFSDVEEVDTCDA